jgi:holin-like protein
MLLGLVLIIALQLAGEVVARGLGLPVPGPVLALGALAVIGAARGGLPGPIEEAADQLVRHLSLLFVPAGVGVVQHLGLLRTEWVAILATLVVSTIVTMAVTALVFRLLARDAGDAP